MKQIQQIGQQSIKSVERIGRASLFLFYIFKSGVDCIIRFRLVISQIYYVGVLSVLIVSISGFYPGGNPGSALCATAVYWAKCR